MIIHDAYDRLLMATTVSPAEASGTATSEVIDITEIGGSEHADLVVNADSADQQLTLTIEGAASEDGEFAAVTTLTTEASKEFEWRERIPKYCPRYIRLAVKTGEEAPSKQVSATLRVAL